MAKTRWLRDALADAGRLQTPHPSAPIVRRDPPEAEEDLMREYLRAGYSREEAQAIIANDEAVS